MTHLIFIHGRHAEHGDWVGAIRTSLQRTGRGDLTGVEIKEVDYADVLHNVTLDQRQREVAAARAAENHDHHRIIRHSLSAFTKRPRSPYDFAPKEWVTRQLIARMPEIDRYRRDPEVRNAVRQRVLDQMPADGNAVIVAHSLGSVVAFDLMHYLPHSLHVELLLTIGSPMARRQWRTCLSEYRGRYPTGAAKTWVNLVNRGDWVTAGDGIHLFFPQAIDTFCRLGFGVHGESKYLQSYPAGVAIGDALARTSLRTAR